MQWEILVAVILSIGIYTAVMEARAKRMARKNGGEKVRIGQLPAKEASKKQDG